MSLLKYAHRRRPSTSIWAGPSFPSEQRRLHCKNGVHCRTQRNVDFTISIRSGVTLCVRAPVAAVRAVVRVCACVARSSTERWQTTGSNRTDRKERSSFTAVERIQRTRVIHVGMVGALRCMLQAEGLRNAYKHHYSSANSEAGVRSTGPLSQARGSFLMAFKQPCCLLSWERSKRERKFVPGRGREGG